MMTVHQFVQAFRRALRLKYPVRVNIISGTETADGYDGSYRFRKSRHAIEVAANPSHDFLAVIVHELCHAAVVERHGFRLADHGPEFQKIAQEAVDKAAAMGYYMDIFDKDTDT